MPYSEGIALLPLDEGGAGWGCWISAGFPPTWILPRQGGGKMWVTLSSLCGGSTFVQDPCLSCKHSRSARSLSTENNECNVCPNCYVAAGLLVIGIVLIRRGQGPIRQPSRVRQLSRKNPAIIAPPPLVLMALGCSLTCADVV
jgi:hypothetical protein